MKMLPLCWFGFLAVCSHVAACPVGVSFRWINATGAERGPLDLTINAKVFGHQVRGPQVTEVAKEGLGRKAVVVAGAGGVVERFEWEVEGPESAMLVTAVVAGGVVQTRVLRELSGKRGEQGMRLFNAANGRMIELTGGKKVVRVRPGREVVVRAQREIQGRLVQDGREPVGFKMVLPEKPDSWEVVALLRAEGEPGFLYVRGTDGQVGESWAIDNVADWPALAVDAVVREPAAGEFDAAAHDWEKVKSRICWFNACQTKEALNFRCNGAMVFQRALAGAVSGFVKWPAGNWEVEVSAQRSGELGKFPLVVRERTKVFILTTGGKGQALRWLVMASELKAPVRVARVRVVNGFPGGTLRAAADGGAQRPPAIKAAQCGLLQGVEDGWFRGATYEHSGGLKVVLPQIKLPPGDWLAICHLDAETGSTALLSWVELCSGRVIEPGEALAIPEPAVP